MMAHHAPPVMLLNMQARTEGSDARVCELLQKPEAAWPAEQCVGPADTGGQAQAGPSIRCCSGDRAQLALGAERWVPPLQARPEVLTCVWCFEVFSCGLPAASQLSQAIRSALMT